MQSGINDKLLFISKKITGCAGYMPEGADDTEMSNFLSLCTNKLGIKPPEDYIKFLRLCNGFTVEGILVYSTQRLPRNEKEKITFDFIEMNLISRDTEGMEDFLSFGESSLDEYVLQLSSGKYQVRDRVAFDNICEEFETFDDILGFMLDMVLSRL